MDKFIRSPRTRNKHKSELVSPLRKSEQYLNKLKDWETAFFTNAGKDTMNVAPKIKQLLEEQAQFIKQHRKIEKRKKPINRSVTTMIAGLLPVNNRLPVRVESNYFAFDIFQSTVLE